MDAFQGHAASKPAARSAHRRKSLAGFRDWAYLVALAFAVTSCDAEESGTARASRVGVVGQALTDTDSDGLDDDWEVQHFGNLSQTSTGDFDSDGMTNGEEFLHGFIPTIDDGLEDADGDRYPNVFEIRGSADPNDPDSKPTPTFTVNATGGGSHTTVSAAISAANISNGAYQIIGIAPGVYTGTANGSGVHLPTSKPKFLVIGLEGAAKTVIEGTLDDYGWTVANTAVIASLTFRKARYALYVSESSSEVRVVDVLVRDNATASYAAGVHVQSAAKVHIVGSTFLDNVGFSAAQQIYIGSGAATMTNTVVWGTSSATMLAKHTNATLTTNYCLVKGQTLSGTGNLAGTSDPKFRPDAHLLWDSPLRGAGGSVTQSRIDIDGELRPSSARDIGVDQFVDSDADDLADHWELTHAAGVLTTLTSRTQDADSDGLSNDAEYANITNPTLADTDGDGLSDGDEVNVHSTNPLSTDTDGDDMPDAWEVAHGLAPLVANAFDDADGDRYPNIYEYVGSTDPDDASSKPTPTFTVNAAGGGSHTTVSAAISAANISNIRSSGSRLASTRARRMAAASICRRQNRSFS